MVPIFRQKRIFFIFGSGKQGIRSLKNMGVISKVDCSDKASLKKICVCVHFSIGLKDCPETYNYSLPMPEEIFAKLKYFSNLVLSHAYLQIQVNKEYSKLLTINNHKGFYKFNSSNLFQASYKFFPSPKL